MHYYELPKLPVPVGRDDELRLWLALFKLDTEEELKQIEALEVPIMQEAIEAFRRVTTTPEFLEKERLRSKARRDEAQALYHARLEATREADEKWQGVMANVVAEKDAALAEKDSENARLREQLAALQARMAEDK